MLQRFLSVLDGINMRSNSIEDCYSLSQADTLRDHVAELSGGGPRCCTAGGAPYTCIAVPLSCTNMIVVLQV